MLYYDIPQWYIELSATLAGLAIGSFLNVVIYRLPRELSIVRPRSACPKCQAMIRWYDNIPLLSFALLRRKCRRCGEKISWRYPLVEAMSGLVAWGCFHRFSPAIAATVYVFCAGLMAISFIDLDFKIIPDVISLPGIAIGLGAFWLPPSFWSRLIGAAAGAGLLLLVAGVYWLATRREGMGLGDVKLLAMIGSFLGWQTLPVILVVSSVVGTVVGLGWIVLAGKTRKFQIPFGPFLSLGAVISLFFGQQVLNLLLRL